MQRNVSCAVERWTVREVNNFNPTNPTIPTNPTAPAPYEVAVAVSLPSHFECQLRRDFLDVVSIVDKSGVADLLDDVLVNRDPHTGKVVGRPRTITPRAVLVAGIVNFLQGGVADVVSITAMMNRFPEDLLRALEVPASIAAGGVPLHKVDHVWNRIADICNPATVNAGKRLKIVDGTTVNEFNARRVDVKFLRPDLPEDELLTKPTRELSSRGGERLMSSEERAERKRRLDRVCDGLLQATVPPEATVGGWAVDWTDYESWGLSHRTGARTSADPDASWGRRRPRGNRVSGRVNRNGNSEALAGDQWTGNQAFEADKQEYFFGYNVHLAVSTSVLDGAKTPELAGSIRLTAANDMRQVAPILVDMVDSLVDAGHDCQKVYIDLGYSMRTPDTWLIPLSDRGVFVCFDLDSNKLGRHGSHNGAPLIGGEPHCPMTPDSLTTTKTPPLTANRDDWKAYWESQDQLEQYRLRRLGRATPDLHQRFQCPAAANKVRCPLYPASMSLPHAKDIPEIYDPPQNPPRCCTTPTMSVGRDVGLGARQQYFPRSKHWVLDYQNRTAVERFNSSIKYEQETGRGQLRVLGLAKVSLMLAMAAVSTNIRHLRNWESETGTAVSTLASSATDRVA